MPCPRALRHFALATVLLLNAPAVWSLGWARSQQTAVLGQPLSFSATLRLDPGDEVDPACIAADVSLGDHRLSPAQVRLSVDQSQREALVMRVSSAVVVDEPVVAVTLAIGCPARMSRRFVLLADPPDLVQPVALPAAALAQAEALAAASAPSVAAAPVGRGGASTSPPAPATPAQPVALPPVTKKQPAPAPAVAARPAEKPATQLVAKAPAKPPAKPAAAATVATAAAPAVGRLKLDLSEPLPKAAHSATATATAASAVAAALEAVADAASAARAAASAASQAQARLASMEKQVAALQFEAQQSRDIAAQMRSRLTSAEGAAKWLTPLLLALVALAGVAGWLAWKLRQLQAARQASWRQAAAADAEALRPVLATSQLPLVTSEIMAPSTVPGANGLAALRPLGLDDVAQPATGQSAGQVGSNASAPPGEQEAATEHLGRAYAPYPHLATSTSAGAPLPATAATTPPLGPMERTLVLPPQPLQPPVSGLGDAARDVSIEELLDLEQQAEFFIVLGQEDAAIDLLVGHLRDTGGGSALPYLKLLEIYRRRGDREAYERTRTRFNHRFNAYAPDWGTDLMHGRTLEDYVGVLPRLQQVWAKPLDAMAELEALLFRKSRGELFDLPAYREVLFLYALARDLLDRAPTDNGSVDLLLPLADGREPGIEGPGPTSNPYFGLERDSVFDTLREDRPTVPVDLDLTQPDMPVSILDPLSPRKLR